MSIFLKLSEISRKRKLNLLNNTIVPTKEMKVLDVGAEVDPRRNQQLQFIDSYRWKNKISAVNLSAEHIASIKKLYPEIEAVVADACQLPWPDKHFDFVYCNAVIEHLDEFEKQKKLAAEIMRVGKCWFITTPNRWYPFEFHMRLPLVTWLGGNAYLWAGRLISYNHVKGKYTFGNKKNNLRLISTGELKQCFPNSRIIKQRITFMAETLIVIGGDITLK